jgi:DNA adenine methylase
MSKLPNNQARPFLRWAGSKKQILPILERYCKPTHKRYVEPFVGSACLFFRVNPPRAILGDLNQELISTYMEVKYRVTDVVSELAKLESGKDRYLELRGANVDLMTPSERAARFIYLNRFCFNGLWRTNLKGKFNVPYGGNRSGNLPSEQQLVACSHRLRVARLIAGDFEKVLDHVETGDFVYMDPPFSVAARRVFKEYNSANFDDAALNRLRARLVDLADRKIDFLVSYAESDEADVLSEGFCKMQVSVRRNIAGFADSRIKSNEVLISPIPLLSQPT